MNVYAQFRAMATYRPKTLQERVCWDHLLDREATRLVAYNRAKGRPAVCGLKWWFTGRAVCARRLLPKWEARLRKAGGTDEVASEYIAYLQRRLCDAEQLLKEGE